jgi:hypothetical protein
MLMMPVILDKKRRNPHEAEVRVFWKNRGHMAFGHVRFWRAGVDMGGYRNHFERRREAHSYGDGMYLLENRKEVCDGERKNWKEVDGYIRGTAGRTRDACAGTRCEWPGKKSEARSEIWQNKKIQK